MIQAKEVMPGFPSSPVVHLVCPTKKKTHGSFFCVPPCERKRMIIYNLQTILFWGSILAFGLVSVEGLGDGWRCLDDWLSVSLESTRWRWLFVFRLLPRKHLLQLKLKFHDLRFWKASCFGCSIHPKAHPNKCPKRKQRSTKSSTSCDLLWIYMNCKAQGNLRSLQKLQAGCAQAQFGCCFSPRSWILLQCTNFDEHLLQLFS